MNKKSILKKLMGMVLVVTMIIGLMPTGVTTKAAVTTNVPVTEVDDITSPVDPNGVVGEFNQSYSFKLKKAGIVKISMMQDYYEFASLVDADGGVFNDYNATSPVKNGDFQTLSKGESVVVNTWLEPGTYYIKTTNDADNSYSSSVNPSGKLSIGVACEYVDKTCTKNTKFSKAGKIKTNTNVAGFFSSGVRKQVYKFTLPSTSKVTVSSLATEIVGTDESYGAYYVSLSDDDYKSITKKKFEKSESTESFSKVLKKGTYYVTLDASASNYFYGVTNLKVKAVKAPDKPTVTSCKANTTVVKGKTTAGSKVSVSYDGNTYKGKAASNGKYSIKTSTLKKGKKVSVYAVKSGIKSNVCKTKVR